MHEAIQTAARRLAEALFVSSVLVHAIIRDDAGLTQLTLALEQLSDTHGPGALNRAAELIEAAYDRLCSEIFLEP